MNTEENNENENPEETQQSFPSNNSENDENEARNSAQEDDEGSKKNISTENPDLNQDKDKGDKSKEASMNRRSTSPDEKKETHAVPKAASNMQSVGTDTQCDSRPSKDGNGSNSYDGDVTVSDVEVGTEKERLPAEEITILPKRYVLLLMLFLGFAIIYSLRVNINVAIVAMVNNRTRLTRSGKITVRVAEFHWDSHDQALVLGSFYYGYWILQVPGAWIAMKLGSTRIFGYGTLLASLLALITPVATRYHVYGLVGIRIVQGLFLGVTFPCVIAIWAKWSPPTERSTMVTMAIAGSPVGNIIAIPVTGLLAKYGFDGGWPSVFYFFGFLGILWYILWAFIIYDTPSTHPGITSRERNYIEKSIAEKPFDPLTESPPWKAIFTSVPMWAIIVGHFGACWGYYTLFTQMPTYLKDVQHLDIKTMGLVAATPYLFKAFLGPLGGISADMILRYGYLTVTGVRKLFYGVGCILAGFFILMVGYYVKKAEAIAFLILGVGFSGLNATGYAVNHLDLAPRYAGVLMGITNTFATIPGFLSPMVTGYIVKNKKASEWKIVFWITFIIYVIAVGLYSIMCSGERQWWADGYPENDNEDGNENITDETINENTDPSDDR